MSEEDRIAWIFRGLFEGAAPNSNEMDNETLDAIDAAFDDFSREESWNYYTYNLVEPDWAQIASALAAALPDKRFTFLIFEFIGEAGDSIEWHFDSKTGQKVHASISPRCEPSRRP